MPRMGTKSKESFKTLKDVFDLFTEKNISKLINQGFIDGLESPLSVGKEANIFTAVCGGERRIVKIYRLQTCIFNKMFDYLRSDPRYSSIKSSRRDVIFAWAQREYKNLFKAREAGVRVPAPYALLFNIVIMEFIGSEFAAQRVKDDVPLNPVAFFDELVEQAGLLYRAGLVHADLSGFNVLNLNQKPVLIDLSQATPLNNPNALSYLERDVLNLCRLAKKWGISADSGVLLKRIQNF